ncbi:uncharacterized protein [Rutidosis leptorrhynchoides]|uniref:uncharacterized protein isoform X1 n=1 Tax=Rutidosis leptorrhynchoides TaxID=125765 RepID=UPI003A99DB22
MEHDEQQQQKVSINSASCEKLPSFSSKYPWFILQNLKDDNNIDTEFFSTLHDPLITYQSQIPEFYGKRIRGCFHGWLILSDHPDNVLWSLWNPVTLKFVLFPPLSLKDGDGESIDECLLTAPPDDPTSVLLLTRRDASKFVLCQINRKRNKLRWTEMSYACQLKRMTYDGELLHNLSCCNGKIYALNYDCFLCPIVVEVRIVVKKRGEVMIQLLMFGACPWPDSERYSSYKKDTYIRGHGNELFCVKVYYHAKTKKIVDVFLFRLDTGSVNSEELECLKKWDLSGMTMDEVKDGDHDELDITRVMWEEINDLKDAFFYLDLGRNGSIYYNPAVGSKLGGYIHIRDRMDEILHLYHVRDRTIISSPMPLRVVSTTRVSMWEGRLEDDRLEANCTSTVKQEKDERVVTLDKVFKPNRSRLHCIPFDVLWMIMEHCVGVEYLYLRATCKLCRLAAPLSRLRSYSINSLWLMVVDKHRGIIAFTDPMTGDNYFMMKNFKVLSLVNDQMYCSRYGWLLFKRRKQQEEEKQEELVLFNPFTSDVRKLPAFGYIKSLCFSAPPNSSNNCIVAGFTVYERRWYFVYSVGGAWERSSWRLVPIDDDDDRRYSLTFIGRDLYALSKDGEVFVFKNLDKREVQKTILAEAPPPISSSCDSQYFLINCDDEHLLLVVVGEEFGEVEVYKRNDDADKWEKIDGIGKHTIYIGGTTSVCVDAKTPDMENKIYFPQLVWYSLETHTYHTLDGKIVKKCFGGGVGVKTHFNCHVWIQPSWC